MTSPELHRLSAWFIDNKRSIYAKIPHHTKNEREERGLWSEYSLSNKSIFNTLGFTEQSSSINNSNKNKFDRKINTSVFPANPFDSVNEAREYFFFND